MRRPSDAGLEVHPAHERAANSSDGEYLRQSLRSLLSSVLVPPARMEGRSRPRLAPLDRRMSRFWRAVGAGRRGRPSGRAIGISTDDRPTWGRLLASATWMERARSDGFDVSACDSGSERRTPRSVVGSAARACGLPPLAHRDMTSALPVGHDEEDRCGPLSSPSCARTAAR